MFEVFAAIFIPTVAIIPVCLVVYFYIDERKKWNKGICPDCNKPWEFVGYDWEGERVYICDDNKHMCKISYHTIDKRR